MAGTIYGGMVVAGLGMLAIGLPIGLRPGIIAAALINGSPM